MSNQIEPYHKPQHRELSLMNVVTDSWVEVLEDVAFLAGKIATTEFVPVSMRGNVPKVVAAIMHSRELGLPPMTGLAHTHVVGGRTGISAELMRALIAQNGHQLRIVESTDLKCVVKTHRREWDDGEWSTYTFTMGDAAARGLTDDKVKDGKRTPSMFRKFPAEMLLARCTTRAARADFADVIQGMRSLEELDDYADEVYADGAGDGAGPATQSVARQPVPVAEGSAALGVVAAEPGGAPIGPGVPPTETTPTRKRAQTRRDRAVQAPAAPVAGVSTQEQESVSQIADSGDEPVEAVQQLGDTAARQAHDRLLMGHGVDQATGEIVEGEIVDDQVEQVEPLDAATPDQLLEHVRPEAHRTFAALIMHFTRLGVTERDERLFWTGKLAGRAVTSSHDLSTSELRTVESKLGRLRNQEALDALLKEGETK